MNADTVKPLCVRIAPWGFPASKTLAGRESTWPREQCRPSDVLVGRGVCSKVVRIIWRRHGFASFPQKFSFSK